MRSSKAIDQAGCCRGWLPSSRGDRCSRHTWGGQGIEDGFDPRDGSHVRAEALVEPGAKSGTKSSGSLRPRASSAAAHDVGQLAAAKVLVDLLRRPGEAEGAEGLDPHRRRDGLAVDEDAVAIEDDELGGHGPGGYRHPQAPATSDATTAQVGSARHGCQRLARYGGDRRLHACHGCDAAHRHGAGAVGNLRTRARRCVSRTPRAACPPACVRRSIRRRQHHRHPTFR